MGEREDPMKREGYMGRQGGSGKGRQKDLEWFASYIKNRTQSVKVSGFQSEKWFLQFGVPQGFVLGPVLFTMYIQPYYKKI